MTSIEIKEFIDCLTYQDCKIKYNNRYYWCMGVSLSNINNTYSISVYEEDPTSHQFVREIFLHESTSKDECMKCFLNEKFWEGKSFYNVAKNMEWVDL